MAFYQIRRQGEKGGDYSRLKPKPCLKALHPVKNSPNLVPEVGFSRLRAVVEVIGCRCG